MIAHKFHLEKYPAWENWDQESRARASGLLGALSTLQFCVVWTTVGKALTYLRGPSKKIQGESLDLYDAVGQIKVVQGDLQHEKMQMRVFFKRCYNYACSMAKLVGIVPSMPGLASRQMHHENAEADTPEDYYRRNVCLPFLDHLIQGIDSRFDKYGRTILLMMGLVPSVVADKEDVTIDDAVKM